MSAVANLMTKLDCQHSNHRLQLCMSRRSQDLPSRRSREVPKLPVMSRWHHLKVKMIQAFPPIFQKLLNKIWDEKPGYEATELPLNWSNSFQSHYPRVRPSGSLLSWSPSWSTAHHWPS